MQWRRWRRTPWCSPSASPPLAAPPSPPLSSPLLPLFHMRSFRRLQDAVRWGAPATGVGNRHSRNSHRLVEEYVPTVEGRGEEKQQVGTTVIFCSLQGGRSVPKELHVLSQAPCVYVCLCASPRCLRAQESWPPSLSLAVCVRVFGKKQSRPPRHRARPPLASLPARPWCTSCRLPAPSPSPSSSVDLSRAGGGFMWALLYGSAGDGPLFFCCWHMSGDVPHTTVELVRTTCGVVCRRLLQPRFSDLQTLPPRPAPSYRLRCLCTFLVLLSWASLVPFDGCVTFS